jgi:hypothetical protein
MNMKKRLAEIRKQAETLKPRLAKLRAARRVLRAPVETKKTTLAMAAAPLKLVAQGDSWFDYLPGKDLIDHLVANHGRDIESIAVGGSTLNDIVYGPVPENWLGIPQSDAVDRMTELVSLIDDVKPQALLLSGGGNDIAGMEFFSFLNNAKSGLPGANDRVLRGAIQETFTEAYRDLIMVSLAAAATSSPNMKIFIQGYDYPWPDGRGVTIFDLKGPWFHESFNKKNFPYKKGNAQQLKVRYDITKVFMDALNEMLQGLEAAFPAKCFMLICETPCPPTTNGRTSCIRQMPGLQSSPQNSTRS